MRNFALVLGSLGMLIGVYSFAAKTKPHQMTKQEILQAQQILKWQQEIKPQQNFDAKMYRQQRVLQVKERIISLEKEIVRSRIIRPSEVPLLIKQKHELQRQLEAMAQ